MKQNNPGVGVAVWIRKEGKVLLGKRVRGAEPQTWCPPGGALDSYETAAHGAIRETKEETGLNIKNPYFLTVVDDIFKSEHRHWVTIYFVVDWKRGEPRSARNEIGKWQWVSWDKLPKPLFGPTKNFVKTGINPLKS